MSSAEKYVVSDVGQDKNGKLGSRRSIKQGCFTFNPPRNSYRVEEKIKRVPDGTNHYNFVISTNERTEYNHKQDMKYSD